jgi:Zn-dependent protease
MRHVSLHFTRQEIKDLFISWALLSIAFAIIFNEGLGFTTAFLVSFGTALIIVAVAFVLHELAHKYVAIHYGCSATFKANILFCFLAVIMSFFGFIFAAPGAVYIQGTATKKQYGHIALAGPGINLIAAIITLPLALTFPYLMPFTSINALLATFNLIPFPGFDGEKILAWHKGIFAGVFIISIILTFITFL